MPDYGTDYSTFPVVDTRFPLISGRRVVAEAIARRLSTPRGKMFWDPNYGTDLRRWLNDEFDANATPVSLAVAVEAEAVKDDRVVGARASVSFTLATRTLHVSIELELSNDDKFRMVLAVDQVTVALLEAA